jgi:hypothetical protein
MTTSQEHAERFDAYTPSDDEVRRIRTIAKVYDELREDGIPPDHAAILARRLVDLVAEQRPPAPPPGIEELPPWCADDLA